MKAKQYTDSSMSVGQSYGRLTAIAEDEPNRFGHKRWLFQCECGNTTIAKPRDVKTRTYVSCGCHRNEIALKSSPFVKGNELFVGEGNPAHKLTEEQVLEIRKLYDTTNTTYRILGEQFNVHYTMIYRIIRNKNWTKIL